jgi:hypothetical protein
LLVFDINADYFEQNVSNLVDQDSHLAEVRGWRKFLDGCVSTAIGRPLNLNKAEIEKAQQHIERLLGLYGTMV